MNATNLLLVGVLLLLACVPVAAADPDNPEPAVWALEDGLTMALHDAALSGPRGLIRLGIHLRPEDRYAGLLNFVAVEPVTMDGRRGFSELERSPIDGRPGLIFRAEGVRRTDDLIRVTIRMEKFVNGAHPYLVAEMRKDRPREVRFEVFAEPDSAPMRMCILTATMGNMQRLRFLEMKDRVVDVNGALPMDPGDNFTPHAVFPLREMVRNADGAIVRSWGSEDDPRVLAKRLPPQFHWWAYGGLNFVQYWRQPEPVDPSLRTVVNARKTYYMSQQVIPGGKAIENFELNAEFHPGQVFIYGMEPPRK